MRVKLVKQSSRSQKYRISIPVEYFERMGYAENDVVDVDITVRNDSENNPESIVETGSDAEHSVMINDGGNAENNNSAIIPHDQFIPVDNVLYVGKKLYYSVNGKIVDQDDKQFEIDINTGKIKNSNLSDMSDKVKSQNITNYAKFV